VKRPFVKQNYKLISQQVAEYRRSKEERGEEREISVREFIEKYCKILDESGNLVHPILRPAQEKIHYLCEEQLDEEGMVRVLIGKFRKPGASTYVELRNLCKQIINPNITAALVAHRDDSTAWIGRIPIRAYYSLPQELKDRAPLAREKAGKDGLKFAPPYQGVFLMSTAGGRAFGHGVTPQLVHLSEVAWFPPSADFMAGLGNSLRNIPGSEIVQESTFNGRDPFFYPEWIRAKRGESEYRYIFLGLLDEEKSFPFYSIPLKPGEELKLKPDEAEFQRKHGVPDALMKFVVLKKNSPACAYRWDMFNRMFPLNEGLAISISEGEVFSGPDLDWLEDNHVKDPAFICDLEFENEKPLSPILMVRDAASPIFEVWEEPLPDYYYVITLDVAQGFKGDFSALNVWKMDEGDFDLVQVAHCATNTVEHQRMGVYAYQAGALYNWGLIIIEVNNFGWAVITNLEKSFDPKEYPQTVLGYPNLFTALKYDTTGENPVETDRLGWLTIGKTKQKLMTELAELIYRRRIIIRSSRVLAELRGFTWNPDKKDYVQTLLSPEDGRPHDDEIVSTALAKQGYDGWKLRAPVFQGMKILEI